MRKLRINAFVGAACSCWITVAGCRVPSELANQQPTAVIQVSTAPRAGEVVTFDGTASFDSDGEIQSHRWDFGDGNEEQGAEVQHTYDAPGAYTVTLTVTDDGGATAESTISVQVGRQLFDLIIAIDPPGSGTVRLDPSGGRYEAGTLVTLTAQPAQSFQFAGFTGDATATLTRFVLLMDDDKQVTARFGREVRLTIAIDPPDGGETEVDPPGGVYAAGSVVTIAALPHPGFDFVAFLDASGRILAEDTLFSLEIVQDMAVVARFATDDAPQPGSFSLDVDVSPIGAGTISLDPSGGVYRLGTSVTITANPSTGYEFVRYSGDVVGTIAIATVVMNDHQNVLAEFAWSPGIGNPGNLLVTGFLGANVREFDRFEGVDLGEFVAQSTGGINFAGGIDIGPDGDVFVVDVGVLSDTRVLRFDGRTGDSLGEFISGPGATGFITVRFGPNGQLYVPNSSSDSVDEHDGATGSFVRTFVAAGSGGLDNPVGLAFGPGGNLFVVSEASDMVIEYDGTTGNPVGPVVDLADFSMSVPVDLAFDPQGALYVSISSDESVARVNVETHTAVAFVQPGASGLDSPAGVLFQPDTGNLLVVSQGTNQVLEYDRDTGEFVQVFAQGKVGDSFIFMVFRP